LKEATSRIPVLAREEESRGTRHFRYLIQFLKGLKECPRTTERHFWLELVDWTGQGTAPSYHTGTTKTDLNPRGALKTWLTEEEKMKRITDEDD
jgi:hypothetical protein